IDLVVPVDSQSPFAARNTKDAQHDFLANMLVGLLVGGLHNSQNQSLTNLLYDLRKVGPFAGAGFASLPVAIGQPPTWAKVLPSWVRGDTGKGDYDDMLMQSREAITRVLQGNDTRAYPSGIDHTKPVKVVLTVPYALNDPRYPRIVRDTSWYVT